MEAGRRPHLQPGRRRPLLGPHDPRRHPAIDLSGTHADRLRWATEVIVALSGGLRPDGGPTPSTALRAAKAAELATERPSSLVIVSGCRGGWDGERPETTEARHMAAILREKGIGEDRVFEEDESRDTIGNAVLVRARYLHELEPRPLTVVTSPHHTERALLVFRNVFPPPWTVTAVAADPGAREAELAAEEPELIRMTEEFFSGLRPGDFGEICGWLVRRHSYYAGVSAHS